MDVWLAWSHHLNKTILSFAPPAPKLNKVTLCSTLSGISLLMRSFLGKEARTKSNFQNAERCLCAVFAVLMGFFFHHPGWGWAEWEQCLELFSNMHHWNTLLTLELKPNRSFIIGNQSYLLLKHHWAPACNTALNQEVSHVVMTPDTIQNEHQSIHQPSQEWRQSLGFYFGKLWCHPFKQNN